MAGHPIDVMNSAIRVAAGAVLALALASSALPTLASSPGVTNEGGAAPPAAIDTQLVIRAKARGANYVTTDMGAKVTLRDTATGAVLAEGLTIGNVAGTDPELTAAFRTTLALSGPTHIEATIRAPLSYPHATVSASSTAWVLPGKHLDGEGWVLELPGFVVTLIDPPTQLRAGERGAGVGVTAKVVMMCGCPTEPGGRWDSSTYELRATLLQSGAEVAQATLEYAGEKSTYGARLALPAAGRYELVVSAFDPVTGNVGIARQPVEVR